MFYGYGTILGQEGASLNHVLRKTRFSQILNFRKEAHFAVKKSLPPERVAP